MSAEVWILYDWNVIVRTFLSTEQPKQWRRGFTEEAHRMGRENAKHVETHNRPRSSIRDEWLELYKSQYIATLVCL